MPVMRERLRPTALAPMRTIITVRRQNMSTTPAIAASAEAMGIKVSGPMYIFELLAVESGGHHAAGARDVVVVNMGAAPSPYVQRPLNTIRT